MDDVKMTPTLINGRWELLLPEHRAQRAEWKTGWERERLDSMYANLRPNDLIFDIGAEEGDFPGLWASWQCRVVMVEPNPRVWPNIRAIFNANNLTNLVAGVFVGFASDESRFVSDWFSEHGAIRIDDDPPHYPWPLCAYGQVIGDHGFLVIPERPDVSIITIDELAYAHGLPDAITIDVEGAELRVLRGAENVLREKKPLVWVSIHRDLEWMDLRFPGEGASVLHRYMAEIEYIPEHLATDHEEHWFFHHPDGRHPA